MNSRPVQLNPQLVAGPSQPVSTVRPSVSQQRVLLLDDGRPEMLDLVDGEIRPWENGPPITIPVLSTPFRLTDYSHIQVQLFRDLRSTSVDRVLFSVAMGEQSIDVIESQQLELVVDGPSRSATSAIGASPAVVVTIKPVSSETGTRLVVSARNAETDMSCEITELLVGEFATLTIGGPTTALSGRSGRLRPSAVHIHTQPRTDAASLAKRVATRARREASSILQRRSP